MGLGVLGTGAEYLDEPAMAVMLADFPEGEFSVFSGKARPPQPGARTPSGAGAAHFGVVHGDPNTEDMPELIGTCRRRSDRASSSAACPARAAHAYQIAERGAARRTVRRGALRPDRRRTRLTQGCSPVGRDM